MTISQSMMRYRSSTLLHDSADSVQDGNKNVEIPDELAHARKLLTDKWGNHHNQHLTYIDPRRGITWELTDPQIDTWVHHIVCHYNIILCL